MVPAAFDNFFLATSSGGAALIGLLFVATSISPERIFSRKAPPEVGALAVSAFTALVNAFFVSVAGLIPRSNIGYTALVFAAFGGVNALSLGRRLVANRWQHRQEFKLGRLWLRIARDLFLVIGSLVIYGFEFFYAFQLLKHPAQVGPMYSLCTILLVINGIGLLRAWELLGARRGGLLSWLNPLDADDDSPTES
jgi:hypothetical protein